MAAKMRVKNVSPSKKEPQGCVYLLLNKINGKGYVGQTNKFAKRCQEHISSALAGWPYPLYKAIRKYGVANFSANILWSGPASQLNRKEIYYVKKHSSFCRDSGYNLTLGGEGRRGHKLPKETCLRISIARKAYFAKPGSSALQSQTLLALHKADPELRWKCGASIRAAHLADPSINMRQSAAALRRYQDPKEREKAGRARRGISPSAHTRALISIGLTGRKQSVATVEKRNATNRGRKRSPEACARIKAGIHHAAAERKLASA